MKFTPTIRARVQRRARKDADEILAEIPSLTDVDFATSVHEMEVSAVAALGFDPEEDEEAADKAQCAYFAAFCKALPVHAAERLCNARSNIGRVQGEV